MTDKQARIQALEEQMDESVHWLLNSSQQIAIAHRQMFEAGAGDRLSSALDYASLRTPLLPLYKDQRRKQRHQRRQSAGHHHGGRIKTMPP